MTLLLLQGIQSVQPAADAPSILRDPEPLLQIVVKLTLMVDVADRSRHALGEEKVDLLISFGNPFVVLVAHSLDVLRRDLFLYLSAKKKQRIGLVQRLYEEREVVIFDLGHDPARIKLRLRISPPIKVTGPFAAREPYGIPEGFHHLLRNVRWAAIPRQIPFCQVKGQRASIHLLPEILRILRIVHIAVGEQNRLIRERGIILRGAIQRLGAVLFFVIRKILDEPLGHFEHGGIGRFPLCQKSDPQKPHRIDQHLPHKERRQIDVFAVVFFAVVADHFFAHNHAFADWLFLDLQ